MKDANAFKTISEVAEILDLQQHVLRFWETRFSQIKPMKRGGGRRYYRPEDVDLLAGIKHLLYAEGYTIKGVQRLLKDHGTAHIVAMARGEERVGESAPVDELPATPVGAPEPTSARPTAPEARARLQSALGELLECKRLLDQVR